jgi:hypothetical protein
MGSERYAFSQPMAFAIAEANSTRKDPAGQAPEKGDPLDPAAVAEVSPCICRNPGGLPNVYEGQRALRQALMPYLILSDIHGNREALEAVLDHAQVRYDEILCLDHPRGLDELPLSRFLFVYRPKDCCPAYHGDACYRRRNFPK